MNNIEIYAGEQHVEIKQNNFANAIENSSGYVGDNLIYPDPIIENRKLIILSSMIAYLTVTKNSNLNFGFVRIPKEEAFSIERLNDEFLDEVRFFDIPDDTNNVVHISVADWNEMTNKWCKETRRTDFSRKIDLFSFSVKGKTVCLVPASQMVNFFKRLGMKAMTEDAVFMDKGNIVIHRIGKKVTDDFTILLGKRIVNLKVAFRMCIDKLS